MNTLIWNREDGSWTFAVKFANGNFAEYVGYFAKGAETNGWRTKAGAEGGAKACHEYHGEGWENHNLSYDRYEDDGSKTSLFVHRNGN